MRTAIFIGLVMLAAPDLGYNSREKSGIKCLAIIFFVMDAIELLSRFT